MHNLVRMRAALRAVALAFGLAALVGVGAVAGAASQPGLPQGVHGPTVYGQVVAVGSSAVVLQLANGDWVALNVGAQTVVVPPPGSPPGLGGVQNNDYVLATYSVVKTSGSSARWLVADWLTYAASALSIGQSVHVVGTVGTVRPDGSFTVQTADQGTWLVTLSPQTVVRLGKVASSLSFLQPGDGVQVWGTAAGQTIVATRVVYQGGANGDKPNHAPNPNRGSNPGRQGRGPGHGGRPRSRPRDHTRAIG